MQQLNREINKCQVSSSNNAAKRMQLAIVAVCNTGASSLAKSVVGTLPAFSKSLVMSAQLMILIANWAS